MSNVDHPKHYNSHPSGIEAISICEHLPFNVGNAVKYVMRAAHKGARDEDMQKAAWYLNREAERVERTGFVFGDRTAVDNVIWILLAEEPSTTVLSDLLVAIANGALTSPSALRALAERVRKP